MTLFALGGAIAVAAGTNNNKRPSDDERGRELYLRHCLMCHGAAGRGDGAASSFLVHAPSDLQGRVKDDDATAKLVLKGKEAMPGFEASFDRYDAHRVLKYMANLGKAKPKPVGSAPAGSGPAGSAPAGSEPVGSAPEPELEAEQGDAAP